MAEPIQHELLNFSPAVHGRLRSLVVAECVCSGTQYKADEEGGLVEGGGGGGEGGSSGVVWRFDGGVETECASTQTCCQKWFC